MSDVCVCSLFPLPYVTACHARHHPQVDTGTVSIYWLLCDLLYYIILYYEIKTGVFIPSTQKLVAPKNCEYHLRGYRMYICITLFIVHCSSVLLLLFLGAVIIPPSLVRDSDIDWLCLLDVRSGAQSKGMWRCECYVVVQCFMWCSLDIITLW